MRVMHIITGLRRGGAETMLARLLAASAPAPGKCTVVCLAERGPLADAIEAAGVPVRALDLRGGLSSPRAFWRLVRLIREQDPDVIQTWMYHADLLGGLAARVARPFAGRIPVVWGVRMAQMEKTFLPIGTRTVIRLCAWGSRVLPDAIVVNAKASERTHTAAGYCRDRFVLIPNGFDLGLFKPDAQARASLREELSLGPNTLIIGMAARFDPQKDYDTFLDAAAIVASERSDAVFVACGSGVTPDNPALTRILRANGIEDRVHLLGPRTDMARLQAAFDIAVSSSISEGFPNAIGEAMACGVPCVVTDVGDSAALVGDTGRVVPTRDAPALADEILELAELGPGLRQPLGRRARAKIEQNYEIGDVAGRFEALWRRLATSGRKRR